MQQEGNEQASKRRHTNGRADGRGGAAPARPQEATKASEAPARITRQPPAAHNVCGDQRRIDAQRLCKHLGHEALRLLRKWGGREWRPKPGPASSKLTSTPPCPGPGLQRTAVDALMYDKYPSVEPSLVSFRPPTPDTVACAILPQRLPKRYRWEDERSVDQSGSPGATPQNPHRPKPAFGGANRDGEK